tara:strand:+ start:299 stop:493 length:195 start_codon:yes stop_codon:yes gene_type:complete
MKTYLIPLAILVGSIIVSVGVYLAITSNERSRFNHCLEMYSEKFPEAPLEQTKKLCKNLQYLEN